MSTRSTIWYAEGGNTHVYEELTDESVHVEWRSDLHAADFAAEMNIRLPQKAVDAIVKWAKALRNDPNKEPKP